MSLDPPGVYVGNTRYPLFEGDSILCLDGHGADLGPHYHRVGDVDDRGIPS